MVADYADIIKYHLENLNTDGFDYDNTRNHWRNYAV